MTLSALLHAAPALIGGRQCTVRIALPRRWNAKNQPVKCCLTGRWASLPLALGRVAGWEAHRDRARRQEAGIGGHTRDGRIVNMRHVCRSR